MTTASLFKEFIKNIRIQNSDVISDNYNKVTKALNEYYYESESTSTHCRQIGSYGRKTGINGISDLDMAFELPKGTYDKFKTLGAKRYLTLKNGVFNLTLAGLSKEKGLCYLIDRANGVEDVVFDLFDNELYVPAEHTGKLLHTYIDTPATFVVSDYLGTNAEVHSPSGVHLEGTDFTLSIDREVGNVLEMLFNDGYLKEGSFYDGSN